MPHGNAPPARLHIVGGPGTGKTTLAHRVAAELRLPMYEIEAIAYAQGSECDYQLSAPLAFRHAEVARIAAQPAWVTEGTFLWWTDALFEASDVILWLDLPWPTAFWRIVGRHIGELRRSLEHPDSWRALVHKLRHPRLRQLVGFVQWARRYYFEPWTGTPASLDDIHALTRAMTASHLAPYAAKVVRCACPAELEHFLSTHLPEPSRPSPGPSASATEAWPAAPKSRVAPTPRCAGAPFFRQGDPHA